jgi:hypothetical protein
VAQLQAGRASLNCTAASWQPHWQASPAQAAQVQRSFMALFIAWFMESSFRLVGFGGHWLSDECIVVAGGRRGLKEPARFLEQTG